MLFVVKKRMSICGMYMSNPNILAPISNKKTSKKKKKNKHKKQQKNNKQKTKCNMDRQVLYEVTENGFKNDLCLTPDDLRKSHYSLLKIVNEKMDSIEHKKRGCPLNRVEMLSLLLYTGCDSNYDMCKAQRSGNYIKWECFDSNLLMAIRKLSNHEILENFTVYSGLGNVKLDEQSLKERYFPTYTSTSWNRNVSMAFIQNNVAINNNDDKKNNQNNNSGGGGMLIELNKNAVKQFACASVDWVSKFTDECEVLIARTWFEKKISNLCQLKIDDNIENNVQIVSLTTPKKQNVKNSSLIRQYGEIFQMIELLGQWIQEQTVELKLLNIPQNQIRTLIQNAQKIGMIVQTQKGEYGMFEENYTENFKPEYIAIIDRFIKLSAMSEMYNMFDKCVKDNINMWHSIVTALRSSALILK